MMKLSEVRFSDFAVGYGKADITPDYRTGIGLTGNNDDATRLSTGRRESIMANCVAFTDTDGTTVILFGTDMHGVNTDLLNQIRAILEEKTGVPGDHIQMCASHNHQAPNTSNDTEAVQIYQKLFVENCVQAAMDALQSRKEAKMSFHFLRPEGMMWVRHYLLMDGTRTGHGLPMPAPEDFCGYMEKGDNLLQLVKFEREGEKDIMLINWQGHPYSYCRSALFPGDKYNYTVLYGGAPAVMRQRLLDKRNCESVYFCGGSGNGVQRSFIRPDNKYNHYEDYGAALGEMISAAYDDFKPAETGKIYYEIDLDKHFPDYKARWEVFNNRKHPYGAFGFGDFGYAAAPCEMFQKNAMRVREESPYRFTIYAQLSNGGGAYIPSAEAFEYPGYEQGPNFSPKYAADFFEQGLKDMLNRTFAASGQTPKEKEPGYITDHSPKPDGVAYENSNVGAEPIQVKNGYCQIKLLADGAEKTLLVENKELATAILAQKHPKLLRNEQNVVVGLQ